VGRWWGLLRFGIGRGGVILGDEGGFETGKGMGRGEIEGGVTVILDSRARSGGEEKDSEVSWDIIWGLLDWPGYMVGRDGRPG
jgi:hypothetical protein